MQGFETPTGPNPNRQTIYVAGAVGVNEIMVRRVRKLRNKEKPASKWCRNPAILLEVLDPIIDNIEYTDESNGAVTLSPSNHGRDGASTMIDTNTSLLEFPSQSSRKTYPQNWPAYNAAQTSEKNTFMVLLGDLCANVEQPAYVIGRPRFPLADMVYTGAIKVNQSPMRYRPPSSQ